LAGFDFFRFVESVDGKTQIRQYLVVDDVV
jgi:hypothetical protein